MAIFGTHGDEFSRLALPLLVNIGQLADSCHRGSRHLEYGQWVVTRQIQASQLLRSGLSLGRGWDQETQLGLLFASYLVAFVLVTVVGYCGHSRELGLLQLRAWLVDGRESMGGLHAVALFLRELQSGRLAVHGHEATSLHDGVDRGRQVD